MLNIWLDAGGRAMMFPYMDSTSGRGGNPFAGLNGDIVLNERNINFFTFILDGVSLPDIIA